MKKLLLLGIILFFCAIIVNAQHLRNDTLFLPNGSMVFPISKKEYREYLRKQNNSSTRTYYSNTNIYSTPYYYHTQRVSQGIQYRNRIYSIRSSYRIR